MRRLWTDWTPPDERGLPKLVPMFPLAGADNTCPHREMPGHTRLVCMVCYRTGAKLERKLALLRARIESRERQARKEIRFRPRIRVKKSEAIAARPSPVPVPVPVPAA